MVLQEVYELLRLDEPGAVEVQEVHEHVNLAIGHLQVQLAENTSELVLAHGLATGSQVLQAGSELGEVLVVPPQRRHVAAHAASQVPDLLPGVGHEGHKLIEVDAFVAVCVEEVDQVKEVLRTATQHAAKPR